MTRYELNQQGQLDLRRVQSELNRPRTVLDRVIGYFSPARETARMKARVGREYFRYEAAQVTGLRSWHGNLQLPPQSSATQLDRTNMLMAGREMVENDPIVNGILRKMEVYIAGSLRYQANTGNDVLDKAVNDYFNHEFWYDCDVGGRFCFQDFVRLAIREQATVGDCGLVWVNDFDGELRLMFIEGDRLGHPYKTSLEKDNMHGILVNALGRPQFYEVYRRDTQSAAYNAPQKIPASEFIHYFETTRADTYRGIPIFHAVQNNLTDLREILESMRIKVKGSAMRSFFINNLTGLPEPQEVLSVGSPTPAQIPGQVVQTSMGQVRFGTPGEKITEVASEYPAPQIQQFYEMLIMTVANALNLSYGLVRDMASLKGPGVRAVLAQDDREFALKRRNLDARLLRPIKNRALLNAAARGKIAGAHPLDENLYKGAFSFPGKLTIDLGRDGQMNVILNNNALQPAKDIYGDEGEDWRDGTEQCVKEVVYLKDLCEKYGVDVQDVRRIQSGISGRNLPAPGEGAAPGDQDPQADAGLPPAKSGGKNTPADDGGAPKGGKSKGGKKK